MHFVAVQLFSKDLEEKADQQNGPSLEDFFVP